MKNFVITGVSAVGKTFLEEQLEKTGQFFQIPKYTNRSQRPIEDTLKNICISDTDFTEFDKNGTFFFTLDYSGYRYGWKSSDFFLYPNHSVTLAITLQSLNQFLAKNPKFVPVLLNISPSNFSLIESRMYDRENYSKLSHQDQKSVKSKISHYLSLALEETNRIKEYISVVKSHQGFIFDILDNQTIFTEVIPEIAKISKGY
jgi:guanylate kinase